MSSSLFKSLIRSLPLPGVRAGKAALRPEPPASTPLPVQSNPGPGSGPLSPKDSETLSRYVHFNPRQRYLTALASHATQHAVVYASRAVDANQAHQQLRDIRKLCAPRNAQADVSCAVVFQDGMFCQWLQGEASAVQATIERIRRDRRHTDILTLYSGPAEVNMMDAWSMGLRSLGLQPADALARAQALAPNAQAPGYAGPYEAWMAFAGIPLCAAYAQHCGPEDPGALLAPVIIISARSTIGGELLRDTAQKTKTGLGTTRWGSVSDPDCDLQTVGGVLDMGGLTRYTSSISAKALRVGAVREAVRQRRLWALMLQDDDVAELDYLLAELERNTPPEHRPGAVLISAPHWRKDPLRHAQHMLESRQWRGLVDELDPHRVGAWKRFGDLLRRVEALPDRSSSAQGPTA